MATYYVRTDGSDANTGLGPGTGQAWASVQKAINSGGVASGDTVYIAPGTYRETAWNGQTFTSTTTFIGDALATQFTGVTPAPVIISTRPSDGAASTVTYLGYVNSFTTIQNIYFDSSLGVLRPYGENIIISDCVFQAQNSAPSNSQLLEMRLTGTGNITIRRCIGVGVSEINCGGSLGNTGTGQFRIESCSFYTSRFFASGSACTFVIVNSNFTNSLSFVAQNASGTYVVFNCILGQLSFANTSGTRIENYNYYTGAFATSRQNVTNGANSIVNYGRVTNWGYFAQNGLILTGEQAPIQNGPLKGAGTSSLSGYSAPTTDLYNKSLSSPPDIGAVTSAAFTGASYYIPTERNASTITIAPGSTSQSIELYLGATGLTASTSGLSARYNRTRTASVSIPLVARTIAQAWTAGGFAEVDATNMPGVYRLDVPDAALAAGADDVTIVVRGASGTNGAVMTVKLSSGGLSSTETAQAVWNATASSYNTAGSMGEAGQRLTGYSLASSQTFSTTGSVGSVTSPVTVGTNNDKTGYSLASAQTFSTTGSVGSVTGAVGSVTGSVGSVTGSVGSVIGAVGSVTSAVTVGTNNDKSGYSLSSAGNTSAAGAVWNSARSTYTIAGTFGQYVNAELVTPVSQGSLVYMGPYQVIADGVTTPQPLDIQKGAVTGIGIQLVDNNLSGISITGATVTTKVYNAGGSLVATYACTATYAADGRASFNIDTTVTNVPGTYTATITRTTGASDTQVFGPLRIYVRDI